LAAILSNQHTRATALFTWATANVLIQRLPTFLVLVISLQ